MAGLERNFVHGEAVERDICSGRPYWQLGCACHNPLPLWLISICFDQVQCGSSAGSSHHELHNPFCHPNTRARHVREAER